MVDLSLVESILTIHYALQTRIITTIENLPVGSVSCLCSSFATGYDSTSDLTLNWLSLTIQRMFPLMLAIAKCTLVDRGMILVVGYRHHLSLVHGLSLIYKLHLIKVVTDPF